MKFKSRLSTLFFKLLLTKKTDALLCFKSSMYFKCEKNEISFFFADFNELILLIFKLIFLLIIINIFTSCTKTFNQNEVKSKFEQTWNRSRTPQMTETTQRITENRLKILPRRIPRTPQMDPRTFPKQPRAKKNRMWPRSSPKCRESRPKVSPKRPVWNPR